MSIYVIFRINSDHTTVDVAVVVGRDDTDHEAALHNGNLGSHKSTYPILRIEVR